MLGDGFREIASECVRDFVDAQAGDVHRLFRRLQVEKRCVEPGQSGAAVALALVARRHVAILLIPQEEDGRKLCQPRKAGTLDAAPAIHLRQGTRDEFRLVAGENSAALAMSFGVERRPSGMEARNRARFSGVSSPMKVASSGVSPATGLMQLTRMLSFASSTAIDLLVRITAPSSRCTT